MANEVTLPYLADSCSVSHLAERHAKGRPKVKRLFDVSAAILLLIILAPLICLIIVAISISGQVPLFSHVRIGHGGQEFGCLKFRTMCRDANLVLEHLLGHDPAAKLEWEANRKLRRDPRVTRIGRFLRATSLDELPQLVNIVIGDMSLVGPRPVTKDELATYYNPSEAAAYSSVRPGLTGLWQVSGRSESGYADRAALDALYAQRLSLRSDFIILFRTVGVVFRQRGAW